MGDFLQIILYKLWTDTHSREEMSIFITMDIICGQIAALITPYVIAELRRPNDIFAGLSIYVNEIEKDKLLNDVTDEQKTLINDMINVPEDVLLGINTEMMETLTDNEEQALQDYIITNGLTPEQVYKYYKTELASNNCTKI